jgi:hypothetical protein
LATMVNWTTEPSYLRRFQYIQFRFWLFLYFSMCALAAAITGYDHFHAKNPSGLQTLGFLIPVAASLFLGFQLIKAYADPLPSWYTYLFSMPLVKLDAEHQEKAERRLIRFNAVFYLVAMGIFIVVFIFPRLGYSRERMILPVAFGILASFVTLSLLQIFAAFLGFWNPRKSSDSMDK